MGIVIDNSGSMREKRNKVNQAALNLVRSSNPQDEVFVVNFNDEQYLDQDFTNNLLKLKEALEKIDARGGTALYDARRGFGRSLEAECAARKESYLRRDRRRRQRQQRDPGAGDQATAAGEWPVRVRDRDPGRRGTSQARQKSAADHCATAPAGSRSFPKTLDEVDESAGRSRSDIRNQYAIGYKPTKPRDKREIFAQIRVEAKAKGHGKLVVRTKTGYYAGGADVAGGAK